MTTGMSLRLELFVEDRDVAVAFYRDVLGFELLRQDDGYASIRSGDVTFGIGPITRLPETGGYFTRARLAGDRGAGVEIVLEVDDLAAYRARVAAAGHPILDDVQERPWGLTDFRIADPDGYYLRLTTRS
jgi:predicted enzyme related to lactoylglutathione lyase